MEEGTKLDWATAETLAFGSLLSQGKRQMDRRQRSSFAVVSIKYNINLDDFKDGYDV